MPKSKTVTPAGKKTTKPVAPDDKRVGLYRIDENAIHLGCEECEDVQITVYNTASMQEAKVKVADFLRRLEQNGFKWMKGSGR